MQRTNRPIARPPRLRHLLAAAVVLAGLSAGLPAHAELPGGASALNETYQDWRVNCRAEESAARCIMVQGQSDARSGQRILAIELTPDGQDRVFGALLLPFGLALDGGVVLQVDEEAPGPALRFSTCLASGCLVPLDLDAPMVAKLRAGTALKINTAVSENGQPVVFSISLKGFSAALARTRELTK